MKLENGILTLEVENKGGEMTSLFYKGTNVLYDGKGEYWSGKNPTLFPIISSPDTKQYTLDGKTYPIKNHGLIRYATLKTVREEKDEIVMELKADEETLKQYPFEFDYQISYRLDGNKVLINYTIKNNDSKDMPFTFGIHPGFVCDFENDSVYFNNDEECEVLTDTSSKESTKKKLGNYRLSEFLKDIEVYHTVVFQPLKTTVYELQRKDYTVKVDGGQFKYLAMWTPDPNSGFLCIEPWCSIDNIKKAINPFSDEFEIRTCKPGEEFHIGYSIEVE